MLCPSNKFALQLNKYFLEKVLPRKNSIYKAVREVSKVVTEVLREVEVQEPRFISSLNEMNGRFEGLTVVSHTEFEVRQCTKELICCLQSKFIDDKFD
jgi:putative nucleotidyltransferase